jgi:hypothetical protein
VPALAWKPRFWSRPLTVELDLVHERILWSKGKPKRRAPFELAPNNVGPRYASKTGWVGSGSVRYVGTARGCFQAFLRLASDQTTPENVLAFASRWGVLATNPDDRLPASGSDRVADYISVARVFARVLELADKARGETSERKLRAVESAVFEVLFTNLDALDLVPTWGLNRGLQLELTCNSLRGALVAELVHALDAAATVWICAECGAPHRRRARTRGASYCDECRAQGVPMKRARAAYRARKSRRPK